MKLKPSSRQKHYLEQQQCIMKKQRTNRRRQVRSQISPILITTSNKLHKGVSGFSLDSTSFASHFPVEISCGSSRVTVESNLRKRNFSETREADDAPFRRITRSYYKQLEESEKRGNEVGVEAEASESSCVESNIKEMQVNEAAESVTELKFSSAKEADVVSVVSGVESCLSCRTATAATKRETELSEISKNDTIAVNDSVVKQQHQQPNSLDGNDDLACTEELCYDDVVSEYSSSQGTAMPELQSELFPEKYYSTSEDLDFSDDYTPSIFFDSGSEFSEKPDDYSIPSRAYSLFLQFRQNFIRSSLPLESGKSSPLLEADYLLNSNFGRLEDEDDEDSYRRLRERERRQMFLHDYPELYRTTTEHADLILQQRSLMVHWIIEESNAKEFQLETTFLGVSLLDRFLTKGLFKNKRHLQIVGIACLTLATRIEENQPYNCVRQRNFYLENSVYNRSEVVAMEWLVQEVLSFQCFLPTIHNFMWFYLKAVRADAVLEKRARYLAVLALSDHEQLRYWPSTVAAVLVMLASLESNEVASYQRVIEVHARTKENDLPECMKPGVVGTIYQLVAVQQEDRKVALRTLTFYSHTHHKSIREIFVKPDNNG